MQKINFYVCELHVSSEIFWSLSNDLTMSTERGDPSVTVSIISSNLFLYVTVSLWMFDISFFTTLEQRVVLSAVLVISILRSEASTDFNDSESCLGCSNIVA